MRKAGKPKTKNDWGDGKQHSISLKTHQKNVKTKRAARANDPAKFVAPRGATDVNRDATTSANLRYGEVERAQAQQGQQIPAWFQSYRDQVSGINTGIQAGYQKAIGEVNARQQATAASDTTARTALGSQMQTDAASRGATVDPSLLAGDVNAANVRNTNQAAFANLLGAQGQANAAYYGGQQQAGSAAELQQKMRLAGDVKGTAADKGAYKSTYVTDARDKERTNLIQRAAFEIPTANAALTAKTSTANSKRTARNAAKTRKAAAKEKGQTVNKYGYTNEQWARFSPSHRQRVQKSLGASGTGKKPTKPAADPNALTPAQRIAQRDKRNTAQNRVDDAGDRWVTYKGTKVTEKKGDKEIKRNPTPSEIKQRLIKEGFSTQEIHIGWLIKHDKPFTRADRAMAKRLGIKVPKAPVNGPGSSSGGGGGPSGTNRP